MAVVVVALLGVYLGVHYAANGSPRRANAHQSTQPNVRASTSPTPSSSPHPAGQANDYGIARADYTFTEYHTATGTRTLHVTAWFPGVAAGNPGAGAKYPLILFAPGFRQCASGYKDLLRQWASAGYVVAAVNFPLTNCYVAAPHEADLANQPADMKFVIGSLLGLSDQPGNRLTGLIAADRVAVAGHSDGGDTVAAMAAANCCRYPLQAVIVLAGAESSSLKGRWFARPTPPMLFVQGTGDTCNPPYASKELYQADTTGISYYLNLYGANHLAPYEGSGAPEPVVEQVTLEFLDRYLAGQQVTPGSIRRAGRNTGISELVSNGQQPSGGGGQYKLSGC